MGRLIDADAVKNMKFSQGLREDGILYVPFGEVIRNINDTPTAYDVDKVAEQLEQQAEQYRKRGFEHEQKGFSAMADKYYGKQCSYLHAIEIVKAGGVE